MTTPLRLGIAGLGTVGAGVVKIVQRRAELLTARPGRRIEISAVSARTRDKDRGVRLSGYGWEDDPVALARRDDVDLFVELMGGSDGPAKAATEAAIAAGKDVVTANKAMLALHGQALAEAAEAAGVALRFEAAVAGGIPVVKALTEGLAEIPATPPEVRAEADARRLDQGHDALLPEIDPETRARLDTRNPMRVQRAWEVLRATGRPLSDWQADTPAPDLPLAACQALVLDAPRDWLNARIARRFDQMLQQGALDEARAILPLWDKAQGARKAIGGPELIAHLTGEMTLEAAREAAITASRQYAKRQRTWFRARMADWRRIPADQG